MAGQLEFRLKTPERRIALTVTQLVRLVRETLEFNLDQCWVVGEISNCRLAPSNHLYFTLKDARSSISVVMFNSAVRRLRFKVDDGMQIILRGRVNLYEARGTLQFYGEEMEPRGVGALQLAFEQLKQKLGKEGLFEAARKQRLPSVPRRIGIVTALGGAALRDMLRILLDRYSNLHVIVRPALVQGPGAASEIADALDDLNADGWAEVIIAGRGGGSLEDLWAFNEELVARAIFRSAIPVVSAVGHEIDYTIADFVADARAPTPTAAAQLVVPIKAELRRRLFDLESMLAAELRTSISSRRRQVANLSARLRDPRGAVRQVRQRLDATSLELSGAVAARLRDSRRSVRELLAHLKVPARIATEQRLRVGRLALRLAQAMNARANPHRIRLERNSARLSEANLRASIARARIQVDQLSARLEAVARAAIEKKRSRMVAGGRGLDAVSPLRVLERGYAVVLNARYGRAINDAAQVDVGDELHIRLRRGSLRANTIGRDIPTGGKDQKELS
jgi:exodeoxyribonuclease VII large subunit